MKIIWSDVNKIKFTGFSHYLGRHSKLWHSSIYYDDFIMILWIVNLCNPLKPIKSGRLNRIANKLTKQKLPNYHHNDNYISGRSFKTNKQTIRKKLQSLYHHLKGITRGLAWCILISWRYDPLRAATHFTYAHSKECALTVADRENLQLSVLSLRGSKDVVGKRVHPMAYCV